MAAAPIPKSIRTRLSSLGEANHYSSSTHRTAESEDAVSPNVYSYFAQTQPEKRSSTENVSAIAHNDSSSGASNNKEDTANGKHEESVDRAKDSTLASEHPMIPRQVLNYVPRVIIKLRDQESSTNARLHIERFETIGINTTAYLSPAWKELSNQGVTIDKLITSVPAAQILKAVDTAKEHNSTYHPSNFLNYFAVRCPSIDIAKAVTETLRKHELWPTVEGAYLEGGPALPPTVILGRNESAKQGHLDRSPANGGIPGGIDARFAWGIPGGDGGDTNAHLQFMDIEWGWILNHEDLPSGMRQIPPPIHGENVLSQGHGTCVLGTVVAVANNIGTNTRNGGLPRDCVGIAPHVQTTMVASPWQWDSKSLTWTYSVANAIHKAIAVLHFGDVLLLEVQTRSADRVQYYGLPVEVEEAEFNAIRLASDLGIVVIEAAGNRGTDLDTITFNTWTSTQFSLNRTDQYFKDSGAIMVGAAQSHLRTANSNIGSRIDCFAWDDNIWTTGYDDNKGPLPSGTKDTECYIGFSGTSGASAIIAGAALAVQGIAHVTRNKNAAADIDNRFSPLELRDILGDWRIGTLSANSSRDADPGKWNADRIGVMPDLREIITRELTPTGASPSPPGD